ncbi:MAG TPA: GNAT family N-acetyltransferase [Sediminibacterium sp.]|nr:GNAT family N-acetyltransferase [Sediminibacterium sp.]
MKVSQNTKGCFIIETPRLFLRDWQESDLEIYAQINADPAVMQYFPAVLSREESDQHAHRLQQQLAAKGYGVWALVYKAENRFIGFTGLHEPSFPAWFIPCTEIGWRLDKKYWNRGLASEAAKACIDFARNHTFLKEIWSFTAVQNSRSEKLMQRIHMQPKGRFLHPGVPEGHWLQEHVLYHLALHLPA